MCSLGRPEIIPDKPAQLALAEGLHTVDRLGEENLVLDIRRQQDQVEKLGDSRSGQAEASRNLCSVTKSTAVDGLLELVREGQHDGDAGGTA